MSEETTSGGGTTDLPAGCSLSDDVFQNDIVVRTSSSSNHAFDRNNNNDNQNNVGQEGNLRGSSNGDSSTIKGRLEVTALLNTTWYPQSYDIFIVTRCFPGYSLLRQVQRFLWELYWP